MRSPDLLNGPDARTSHRNLLGPALRTRAVCVALGRRARRLLEGRSTRGGDACDRLHDRLAEPPPGPPPMRAFRPFVTLPESATMFRLDRKHAFVGLLQSALEKMRYGC